MISAGQHLVRGSQTLVSMTKLFARKRFAPLFWTQLFGSFNDNLFKAAIVVGLTFGTLRGESLPAGTLVNLSTGLLVLPAFLFSATAGALADGMDKARLIRLLKVSELGVMLLGLLGFALGSVPLLMFTLFLMGTQSAFFGPAKYAILPQQLAPTELVSGNAYVELGTFLAILGGTLAGTILVPALGAVILGLLCVGVALSGIVSSRFIPDAAPLVDEMPEWRPVRATLATLRLVRRDRDVWDTVLAASWFWFLGALLLSQLPLVAEAAGGTSIDVGVLMAVFSVSVALGSLLAEKLAQREHSELIDLGAVPWASLAMSVFAFDLAFGATPLSLRFHADVGLLGISGGVFIVPLFASMQRLAAPEERSRVIAGNNIVNAAFMVGASVFAGGLLAAGVSLSWIVALAGLLNLVVFGLVVRRLQTDMLRRTFRTLVTTMYRIDMEGFDRHLPDNGPALVAANHVSLLDGIFLGALAKRPIRFVMDHRWANRPLLRHLFRAAKVIPIASRKEDPQALKKAFAAIHEALERGEVVGIFPEGALTRDGEMQGFRPGIEKILAKTPVPVVPVALGGFWGSFFSHAGGTAGAKAPRRFWSQIQLRAGEALDGGRLSAGSLEEVIRGMKQDLRR